MSLIQRVSNRVLTLAVFGAAVPALSACAATTTEHPTDDGVETSGASQVEVLGEVFGEYRDGTLTLTPVNGSDPTATAENGPGSQLQGFGRFNALGLTFRTISDGRGTGSCTGLEYCGQVAATNNSGRALDNVFVEIREYTGIFPTGSQVAWAGSPFLLSDAYAQYFRDPFNIEAAAYGPFTIGQTKTTEFKWNLAAGSPSAESFGFRATVLASIPRTHQASGFSQRQAAIDACSMPGASQYLANTDDSFANVALPFPHTLYDRTYDLVRVSTNGFAALYQTGTPPPSFGPTNYEMAQRGIPVGLYPFWDDLRFSGADSRVCTAVEGTRPTRSFTITWRNAQINASQPAKTTWTTERITFHVRLFETNDVRFFQYDAPTMGLPTALTRARSASLGEHFLQDGVERAQYFNYPGNVTTGYLPTDPSMYPTRIVRTGGLPANPN